MSYNHNMYCSRQWNKSITSCSMLDDRILIANYLEGHPRTKSLHSNDLAPKRVPGSFENHVIRGPFLQFAGAHKNFDKSLPYKQLAEKMAPRTRCISSDFKNEKIIFFLLSGVSGVYRWPFRHNKVYRPLYNSLYYNEL
jgi:hypothetical protein